MYPGDLAQHIKITKQGVIKHIDLLLQNNLVENYTYELENPANDVLIPFFGSSHDGAGIFPTL